MGLEKLLYLRGVGADFTDCFGQYIRIPEADRQGILTCMLQEKNTQPCEAKDEPLTSLPCGDELDAQVYQLDAHHWTQVLPAFHWCYVDEPWVCLYLPQSYRGDLLLTFTCEQGERVILEVPFGALKPIGDYRIQAQELAQFGNSPFANECQFLQYRLDLLGHEFYCRDVDDTSEPYIDSETRRSWENVSTAPNTSDNKDNLSDLSCLGLGYHTLSVSLLGLADVQHGLASASTSAASNSSASISVASKATEFHGTFMVAPRTAYQGVMSAVAQGKRHKPWGVSLQLYSLRSESQWGIGDFGDLEQLIGLVAEYGADFIQLNPLHALDIAAPEHPSPYSPCDRRRLNPLYIHLPSVPEFEPLKTEFAAKEWQEAIALLNAENWLDYPKVSELKYRAFARLYTIFCEHHLQPNTPRAQRFEDFVAQQGASLREFAQAESLRSPRAIAQDEGFYLYLQFVAEDQLQLCQLKAKEAGMGIGLIRDLAVGAALHGVEVQANLQQFCLNASIGAPPDPFAPQGQNWGLTPLDPVKLKQHQYRHFIALIRANMTHCGALRIDHVMGLLRLWWWPLDKRLGHGAYVYYPVETLLAILCLESQRARCVVIGEDLGLVPPDIIHRLYQAGVYSNELFYFCKDHQGFKPPSQYKFQSLMMLANHDVPTLVAWWTGSDLHLRRQLELFNSDEQLGEALAGREQEKHQLAQCLISQGLLPETDIQQIDIEDLLTAWMPFGASGNSALYSVQWCDLLGDRHAVNIPGTWLEYPNWQRRLPISLSEAAVKPTLAKRLQLIAAARHLPETAAHTDTL
ncbi:4-alpha-glucanotransferase [Shewanella xiamenensis]|uniref:4-alpha-glucanotransferase n=1 Tax=Shewanella xiamenensis TaxID=332186 RepID=A0ABT6U704_9GAMM|nr:4-alpha-glucanotransferase [Shewanella xiamenensis]MDI5830233.1 4-alpha-glucanotransferase [Shewanella xiamenensis]